LDVPIVHGDIRAANVRIDPELRTSILELPFERWMHHASTTYHVTHNDIARHLAPEQLHTSSAWSESISKSTDIYSLAMTLLELVTDAAPFANVASTEDVISAVRRGIRPVVPAESVERMLRLARNEHCTPDSPVPAFENTEVISTPSTMSNKASVPLRDAMASFAGLLAMMWAQIPEQRPSAQQVESRFEELVRLEELVLA
jgi:serine/threonine protein kinase